MIHCQLQVLPFEQVDLMTIDVEGCEQAFVESASAGLSYPHKGIVFECIWRKRGKDQES